MSAGQDIETARQMYEAFGRGDVQAISFAKTYRRWVFTMCREMDSRLASHRWSDARGSMTPG